MAYLLFTAGVVFGSIVSQFFYRCKAAYGQFYLTPIDESGDCFSVRITIRGEQNLLKKNKIILYKMKTQE